MQKQVQACAGCGAPAPPLVFCGRPQCPTCWAEVVRRRQRTEDDSQDAGAMWWEEVSHRLRDNVSMTREV